MTCRIDWTVGIEAVQPWARQWNALALAAPQRLPMLSWDWIGAYVEALTPPGAALHCALAHRQGTLVGVLPLLVHSAGAWRLRVASASTPYDVHSAFGDMLADPEAALEVVPALLRAACSHPTLRLREIALRGVADGSPTLAWPAPPDQGGVRITTHRSWGSYLPIGTCWSEYRRGLSRNFLANLRKAHNRLSDPAMPEATFVWLTGDEADPRHAASFMALESSGWKGQAGSAIGQDERLQRFYAALADNAFRSGSLEWHFMLLGGRTIAAHMAMRCGRALSLLKIAYDESYARLSPGSLLFEATAERMFTRGDTDEINCLTDMAWHRSWNMHRREYFDARLYPSTLFGYGLGLAPRVLFNWLKTAGHNFPGSGHRGDVRDE